MKECSFCGVNLTNIPDDYDLPVFCYSCYDLMSQEELEAWENIQ